MSVSLVSRNTVAADIETRVSMHTPSRINKQTNRVEASGDPYAIVETFHRQYDGSWLMIASVREDDFNSIVGQISEMIELAKSMYENPYGSPSRRIITAEDQ